jgi:hypothetical protein
MLMRPMVSALPLRAVWMALFAAAAIFFSSAARAAPEAHILRVDPRAAQENGNPVLTTVVEIVEPKRVSKAVEPCAALRSNAQLDCMAQALEQPGALYRAFPFPAPNAIFTVTVDGTDMPAKLLNTSKWGDVVQQPGVGTAWLILIDADKRMSGAFEDAKQLAAQFVASMGPNDIVNVMFFNDRQIVKDSKWLPAGQKSRGDGFIREVTDVFPSSGRNRSLLTIIKTGATDGFKALGNVSEGVKIPLHQAMVVLSSGFGGTDPSTTGPGALQLQTYMTQGRFPEDNTALPKTPVPVISVYFPHKTFDEFRQNSLEFMQNLANIEIGGFFSVMQGGQGSRSGAIVSAVRTRFSKMHVVKWRVSCVAPSITQSFRLVFNNVNPPILGDNSFKDVPVGIDPSTWPLDVNVQYTQDMIKRQDGVYPGGAFKVYGDFCWGGDKSRAEVYFLPAGQQVPAALTGADVEKAKRTQQQLIAMGMKGASLEASDTFVEFEAPDKEKILHGAGDQAVVRLVLYDNKARRASGVTADSIIQLKGSAAPFPVLWVLGGLFGLVVIALLVVVIVRSGGRKRGAPPPAPVMAGGAAALPFASTAYAPPGYGPGAPPAPAPPRPAQPNPEFMYGGGQQPGYGVHPPGAQPAPPDPYGAAPMSATRATLQGSAGVFTVVPGVEIRAGRDGAQCGILLAEPRVSGVHSTLKLEGGQLLVRDEHSNNGTLLNGNRLTPGVWTPVPNGSLVRFGPIEFSVRLE